MVYLGASYLGRRKLILHEKQYLMDGLNHNHLTRWGRVMHTYICNLTIVSSDNGLLPGWHQAIIWTNAGILLIGPFITNLSEILIEDLHFTKMLVKMSSAKRRPICFSLNVVMHTLTRPDPGTFTLALFPIELSCSNGSKMTLGVLVIQY